MKRGTREAGRRGGAAVAALVLAAGALGALTPEAEAQTRREGQFLGVGLGAGFDQVACEVCAGTPRSGLAGYVRLGGTLSDRVLVGAELDGWTRSDEGTRQILGALNAVLLLYADAEARFHLRLGAGAVGFRASEEGDDLTSLTVGVSGGIGYDYPITENLSITPFANLVLAPFANLKFNGDEAVSGATLGLLQGGLGLTWH